MTQRLLAQHLTRALVSSPGRVSTFALWSPWQGIGLEKEANVTVQGSQLPCLCSTKNWRTRQSKVKLRVHGRAKETDLSGEKGWARWARRKVLPGSAQAWGVPPSRLLSLHALPPPSLAPVSSRLF